MEKITVDRTTLYKEAWEQPMSLLAKRYSTSDVALAKVCRKLQVPVPPRGYWARIRNGYKVTQPTLPKLPQGTLERATISPLLLRSRVVPEAVQEQRVFEAAPENQISEALFQRRLHPLVQATKELHAGTVLPSKRSPTLDIRVSNASRVRAFRLLSVLFYACEARGFTVEVQPEKGSLLFVKGEKLRFSVEEPSKRISVLEANRKDSWSPKFTLEPTGKLTFRIHEWADGVRRAWSDGAKQTLEEQLGDMICGLVDISLIVREHRLKHERQQEIWREQERIRYLYAERKSQLDKDSQHWHEAMRLREFITYVRACPAEETEQESLQRWSARASQVADNIDPITSTPAEFLKRYRLDE